MSIFDIGAIINAVIVGVRAVADRVADDLAQPTRNWNNPPTFETRIERNGGTVVATIVTTHAVYRYHNDGTPPHDIVAVDAPLLAFVPGVPPKTPGYNSRAIRVGAANRLVRVPSVRHPGAEAQNWTQAAAGRAEPLLAAIINNIILEI